MKKKIKVLFVYPNERHMSTIPPAVTLLSQLLKNSGHETDLFDTTFYEFDDDIKLENEEKPEICKNLVIAKYYFDIEELQQDNGNSDVFFDDKYDETRYDIIDEFKEKQSKNDVTKSKYKKQISDIKNDKIKNSLIELSKVYKKK